MKSVTHACVEMMHMPFPAKLASGAIYSVMSFSEHHGWYLHELGFPVILSMLLKPSFFITPPPSSNHPTIKQAADNKHF